MAIYIPAGIEKIPTYAEINGEIRSYNKRFIKKAREAMNNSVPLIPITKLFDLHIKRILFFNVRNYIEVDIEVSIKNNKTIIHKDLQKLKKILEKYGEVTLRLKQNFEEFQHPGYTKRFFEKTKWLNKKKGFYIRIHDIIPKDGLEYEILFNEEKEKWCTDCNDFHTTTETIFVLQFQNKKEAINKFNSINKNNYKNIINNK